ncbi:MAG: VOC family protein [Stenomitos rutilans HA7619-LM2]|nr:VOC family protein [Stenomitos rutilans HA7619-LM2]
MSIESIDHLYVETPAFEAACTFWKGLGFKLVDQWEEETHRACRLEAGNTYIVLAEAAKPSLTVHFRVTNLESDAQQIGKNESIVVQTPLEATHWGSHWMCVQDPDQHLFALEESNNDS